MDAFESVIALLLRLDGYWTQTSFKVDLTKSDKRAMGKASSPRWEIDVLAYRASTNEVLAVECKSFLNSPGVTFDGEALTPATMYKLFTEARTRTVVMNRLAKQLVKSGLCRPDPAMTLCLAAGKLRHPAREPDLAAHFQANSWRLIGPKEIRLKLATCADARYENDVAFVVAKLVGKGAG